MAKAVINPEAELPPRPRDTFLTEALLSELGVFASLKKTPAFSKFPGTCVLRHYRPGEVICRQGDAGGTAFYVFTNADISALLRSFSEKAGDTGPKLFGELQRLLSESLGTAPSVATTDVPAPRRLATARLLLDTERRPNLRRRGWLSSLFGRSRTSNVDMAAPSTIANDGPADIDYQTRQAPIYEGEVFGEMSCLTRQPRSATIVVEEECFVLEFLRNILEQMRKDPKYIEAADKKYRQRVMEGHLRQLSIFQFLTGEEFRLVQEKVELVQVAPGSVIWDEGDDADALYVVRSGIVQVVQGFPWRLTQEAITNWPQLWTALRATADLSPGVTRLRAALSKPVQEMLSASNDVPSADEQQQLLDELNAIAKTDVLLTAKETQSAMSDPQFMRETAAFPTKVKSWTGLQLRRGNRVLYHILFPQSVRPAEPAGVARVLQYLARGSILGEIGVVRGQPRSAACVAYAHPHFDREATDVELVRVPKELVHEIKERSPKVRAEIEKIIASRVERSARQSQTQVGLLSESRRAEELGLLQGQNLMLIDLDRCTRCGDCVEACISTHDDGHSRLFLDGPRFGKYLIPSSCRQCRDPVCMIGCPVGSIQQGDDGEIRIRDWCIGCGLCADQCPYDSIQMHDAALLPSGAPGWMWTDDFSAPIQGNWNQPTCGEKNWRPASTPLCWGIDMHQAALANRAVEGAGRGEVEGRLYFRVRFSADRSRPIASKHRLLITSQGQSVEAFLNGRPLALSQDAAQKKRSQYVGDIDSALMRRGENLLAVAASPPQEFNATVLDVRIDALSPESDDVEEKLVTERAVVCDQCSSLSGGRHACVYACAHEAAMRVDTWINFPTISDAGS